MKTDQELKLALAGMLPENITPPSKELLRQHPDKYLLFFWKDNRSSITDREWLHVCWLAEQGLDKREGDMFANFLGQLSGRGWVDFGATAIHATTKVVSASWQQRAKALAKVKLL